MLSLKPERERRRAPRRRLGRLATIISSQGAESRYCLVTDISDGGVRLHINGFDVPVKFALLFPGDGPTQSGNYEVVWRQGQDIGAKFVGAV
jgi:PilZ domain